MSFFPGGGAGGGWPPPFFAQPPPGVPPIPFFATDPSQNQGFPPGMQPDYQQQGYNPYAQMPVPGQPPPQMATTPQPQLQQIQMQSQVQEPPIPMSGSSMQSIDRNLEREKRRSDYKSSPGRYSPHSREHRHSPDRGSRSRREDSSPDPRYARRKRSPIVEPVYKRQDSEERGRQRERVRQTRPRDSPTQSPQDKPKVDIDALLQDERLRNVLFAGISKATAKLEQSLQDTKGSKEQYDFEPSEAKNPLFPSASTSQKPRSILKRKDGGDSGGSKALSNLSALERTLHMLRGKGDVTSESAPSDKRSSSERKSPPGHGALGKLAAYDEGNNEANYHHKGEKHAKGKDSPSTSSTKPFWSAPSKLEASKRDTDAFDVKEKMFEEWRQSIGKQSDVSSKSHKREMERRSELVTEYKQGVGVKKRDGHGGGEAENQEELDSTVQNILQSIGFNFDLSKRMQELARKKRMQEDEGSSGIRNASASFMDRDDIAEELKASLLRSGSDLSSIDNLIKEARASSQGSRRSASGRAARSPSLDRLASNYGREVRETSQGSSRFGRSAREQEQYDRPRDRASYSNVGAEQWERVSPESSPQRDKSPPQRRYRERDSLSPQDKYDDRVRHKGPAVSEWFRDDGERNEYFYPDKDYGEPPPSVPLLTSYSSRKKNEDLTGGLLKSMRVENFRVMSRPLTHDNPEDEYMETRRVILPAKSDQDKTRSPVRTIMRKRSASPIPMPSSKERRMSPSSYDDYPRRHSPDDSYQRMRSNDPPMREPEGYPISERNKTPPGIRHRSPSPNLRSLSPGRGERTRSPYRRRTRSRTRSRSPYRRKSPRRRTPSPRRRSRSPRRGRSRSPGRGPRSPGRGARSPGRGTRSPGRKRRSPGRRSPPQRSHRRTPPRRGGRSKSKERGRNSFSKPAANNSSSRNNQAVPDTKAKANPYQIRRDISKLPEKERKAELKKVVNAMGAASDPSAKTEDAIEKEKSASRVSSLMADITSLTAMGEQEVNKMAAEVILLSFEHQQKAVANVASRRSKVLALKADLGRLKKSQNELMRKSQRSGLGNKDPHLKANNLSQMETEKEIERLSVPELVVSLESKFEQTLKGIQAKLDKDTADSNKPQTKKAKPKESVAQKSATPSGSGTKESIAQVMEPSDTTNWTSVTVQDEDLPDLTGKGDKKKTDKANDKKKAAPAKPKKDIYYEYVDSKNHWCTHCHLNLNALDQFFHHLHGKKHFNAISNVAKPWEEGDYGRVKSKRKVGKAQSRRVKGSEMMFPIAGFYCSICNTYSGDFMAADNHLKSDDHYDKYLDFLRENPGYEKKLLLEKTRKGKGQDITPYKKEWPTTEPSPPPGKKGKKSNKSLRQKKEEEKEAGDNTDTVDMELDEDGRNDDMDVRSKVPKMTGKLANSVASILSSLPESRASSSGVEMKSSKEDEVKSLDKFLTIANEDEETIEKMSKPRKKTKKSAKIPVIDVNPDLDVSAIPIPNLPVLTSIPLPPEDGNSAPSTAKTLKEIEDEEKRMMGIDVEAVEEKPLGLVKRPPPLPKSGENSDKAGESKEVTKPKTLDNLFTKMSKVSSTVASQKAKQPSLPADEPSELELKIQQGIQEKLEKEKQKLIKIQERKEKREKMKEERMKIKRKKKVLSDSSSEEDSDTEEEKEDDNMEIKMEIEDKPSDLEVASLPKAEPAGIEETTSCEPIADNAQDGSHNMISSAMDGLIKLEQSPSNFDSKVDVSIGACSAVAIDEVKCKEEVTAQESEVSVIATMESIGSGDIGRVIEQTGVKTETFASEDATQDNVESTSMPDNSNESSLMDIAMPEDTNESNAMEMSVPDVSSISSAIEISISMPGDNNDSSASEIAGEVIATVAEDNDSDRRGIVTKPTEEMCLGASGAQEMDKQKESSQAQEKKTNEKSSVDLPSSEAHAQKMTVLSKSSETKKAQMKKTAVVRALQSESDLIGVLHLTPEQYVKGLQKKQPKKAVAKRGGKSSTRTAKKVVQAQDSLGEGAGAGISMDDFVVLSELAGEEDATKLGSGVSLPVPEAEPCNDSVESKVVETTCTSKDEDEKTDQVEKMDEIEAVKPLSGVQHSRGGKTSARGRVRGKRSAIATKEPEPVSETSLEQTIAEGDNVEKTEESLASEDKNNVVSTETVSTPSSEEAKEDDEAVAVPVVSRTRRGRSAGATKVSPVQTAGRQTRTRGKKKEPVEKEHVEDTEIGISKEENDDKSEDMPSLQSESEAGSSEKVENDQSEPSARTTRSKPSKNMAVMVTHGAAEHVQIQGELELEGKDGKNEEMPSLEPKEVDDSEKNKGRSLRTRQAKKTGVDDEKDKEDGDDSDATITEDGENPESISQSEEGVLEQAGSESGTAPAVSQNVQSPVLPSASNQPQRDPPLSGVVSDEPANLDNVEMSSGTGREEVPMFADPAEFENLPTAGLSLGLEDDDSMEFPDSMAGFTVLDVEGQPDSDDGSDEDEEELA